MPATETETDVLAANEAFYRSFAEMDFPAMEALWATEAHVACVHPGWSALEGRGKVIASFRAIFRGASAPRIRCVAPRVHLLGDVAYVLCVEIVAETQLVATNVFVRERGAWRICHHHAGLLARPQLEGASRDPDPSSLN